MSDNTKLIQAISDAAANATAAARSASAAAGNASKAAAAAQHSAASATAARDAAASIDADVTTTPTAGKIPRALDSGKLDPGWIDGGGSPPPQSNITGLDFIIGEGNVPVLEETPEQVVTFLHGLFALRTSDDEQAMLAVDGGGIQLNAGPDDDVFIASTDEDTYFDLYPGEIDLWAQDGFIYVVSEGGRIQLHSDNVQLGDGFGDTINVGSSFDTVNLAGTVKLHTYKIFNPAKGNDVSLSTPSILTPGSDGASEYVVHLGGTTTLKLLNDGPPMDGQLVRLILPETLGFVLTILDASNATLFVFPSSLPNGNAAAATFRYTDAGWIFCGSEFVDNA